MRTRLLLALVTIGAIGLLTQRVIAAPPPDPPDPPVPPITPDPQAEIVELTLTER